MRKFKTFSALMLAVMMLLTACGQEKTAPTETAEEEMPATFQGMTDADRKYLETYLAAYEADTVEGTRLFEYELFDEFLAPFEYKGLTYPDDPMIEINVTDEEVDDYLTMFSLATLVSDEQYQELTEGAVQKFDVATIDYRGLVDGKESDNTTAADQELVIGSGSYIKGFESGLVGAKIGEEVKLDLKFSPYYGSADVAGKDVTFFVTVKKVQRPTLPQLTVETINEYYKTEFKTMEETKQWFKEALTVKEKNASYSCLSAYLQEKILGGLEVVQYPDREVQHFASLYKLQHELVKGDAGWDVYCSETLGMSYEEFQKEAELYGKEQVKPLLMMYYIKTKEGLTCTTEQLGTFIEGFYTSQNTNGYYASLKAMVEECTEFYGVDYFERQVLGAMASEKIIEYAVKEAV